MKSRTTAKVYERIIILLVIAQTFFFIFMVGAQMNFKAVQEHDGKMPVYNEYFFQPDNTHFVYNQWKGVRLWYLTDIINFGDSIYSIGDVLIFLGELGYLTSMILLLILLSNKIFNRIKGKRKK